MMPIKYIFGIFVIIGISFGGGWWYGLEDAERKINASFPESSRNLPIQNFYAPIKEIKGDAILIEGPKSPNPLEKLPVIREVVIGPNTKIVRKTQKDPAVFAAETAIFLEESRSVDLSDPTPPVPPTMFKEEELKISDLKVGDIVAVQASEDVRTEKRFVAVSVILNVGGTAADTNSNGSSLDPALTPRPVITPPPPTDPSFVP